ncbi:MAG: hypothetical protein F4143_03910 [Gemmatimonadales bacterium]|nr:hypothetical protein [Gemmatimonadales bacterium]
MPRPYSSRRQTDGPGDGFPGGPRSDKPRRARHDVRGARGRAHRDRTPRRRHPRDGREQPRGAGRARRR